MTQTGSNAGAGGPFGPFPVPVRADPDKIFALIKARDPKRGCVTRFARWLGRNPQSLWNLRDDSRGVSLEFLIQIAAALRVDLAEITLAEPQDPRPMAKVA